MTLPSGGNSPPISLADLNTEFGYGTNLAAYQGRVIGTPGGGVKAFNSGAETKLSDFYGTNKVVGGSATLTSGSSYTIPQYRTIRITATAAGGGGGGGRGVSDGFCPGGDGSPGGTAASTSFGSSGANWYLSCNGGGGGAGGPNSTAGTTATGNAGNGANGGAAGTGGAAGGAGGAGAKSTTGYLTNPVLTSGAGPSSAGAVAMSIGGAGNGGGGGVNRAFNTFTQLCYDYGSPSNGSAGGAASILIEWTGET